MALLVVVVVMFVRFGMEVVMVVRIVVRSCVAKVVVEILVQMRYPVSQVVAADTHMPVISCASVQEQRVERLEEFRMSAVRERLARSLLARRSYARLVRQISSSSESQIKLANSKRCIDPQYRAL